MIGIGSQMEVTEGRSHAVNQKQEAEARTANLSVNSQMCLRDSLGPTQPFLNETEKVSFLLRSSVSSYEAWKGLTRYFHSLVHFRLRRYFWIPRGIQPLNCNYQQKSPRIHYKDIVNFLCLSMAWRGDWRRSGEPQGLWHVLMISLHEDWITNVLWSWPLSGLIHWTHPHRADVQRL